MKIPGFALPQKVTIEEYKGEGTYGPKFGSKYTARARVEYGNELTRNQDGDEVVSSGRVYLDPKHKPLPGSRITVDGRTHRVLEVVFAYGFDSHHTMVMLE